MKKLYLSDIKDIYGENVEVLYKDQMYEPYMQKEKGLMGAFIVKNNRVKCHICGRFIKQINWYHLKKHSKKFGRNDIKTIEQYRDVFGFHRKFPLCAIKTSNNHSKANRKYIASLSIEEKRERIKKLIEYNKNNQKKKRTVYPMSRANKAGFCSPEQFKTRMMILVQLAERNPSNYDAVKYGDPSLVAHAVKMFGSWNKAKKYCGLKTYQKGLPSKFSKEDLIAILRKFVIEEKRLPLSKDFTNNPGVRVFYRRFGSWNRAKKTAGLSGLLEIIKHPNFSFPNGIIKQNMIQGKNILSVIT